ncbi:cupin domain-containing protein [Streptomyces sp. NPDC001970]
MSVEDSQHVENRKATPPSPTVQILASVPNVPIPGNAEAATVLITLPPGSTGSPPHRHTGPGFGYVIKGEMTVWAPSPRHAAAM